MDKRIDSEKISDRIPKTLSKIFKEAPLAFSILALEDYRARRSNVSDIVREWKNDHRNPNKPQ